MAEENLEISFPKTFEEALEVIKYLLEENRQLRGKVLALEEKVAELSKNSSTSSKPPSSDIVKPPQERRQPGKRKQGGQPGHQGSQRAFLPPEQVDHVERLQIESCPECGTGLASSEAEPLIQQTIELLEKPVIITEFHREAGFCPCCHETHYAPLPAGVIAGQLLGPRLQSLTGYMKGSLGTSYSELSQFFQDVLGVEVSTGLLANVIKRVSEALKVPYQEVEQALPEQEKRHVDETGWRELGKKLWVWLFCNSSIVYFTIEATRGAKVLRRVLGETFGGAIISDFYSAYVSYANAKQQFCLAHLIRDIKFLTTLPDEATKAFGNQILAYFKRLFEIWHERDRWPPGKFQKQIKALKDELYLYLRDSDVPNGKAATLYKRLCLHWDSIFRFTTNPALYEPTNNHAEQTLRHLIRIRRNTQGSRSRWGQMWNSRFMTVFESCKKQQRNAWDFLCGSVNAYYFNQNYPSLVNP